MKRLLLPVAVLVPVLFLAVQKVPVADAQPEGWTPLFNGTDLSGWRIFLDPKKNADPKKIFTVKDGIIVCEGSVNGYLITEKEYENYVLKVQWRWGEKVHSKRRNSGVFVHANGPDKIWPKAVEAQLMADHAGDFWLVGDFRLAVDPKRRDPKIERHYYRLQDGVEKPLGQWNQYEITCKGKTVELVINDKLVNQGSEAELTKGRILLQSEGAEIHFRNVLLKQLP